jgi:hypothetical protein
MVILKSGHYMQHVENLFFPTILGNKVIAIGVASYKDLMLSEFNFGGNGIPLGPNQLRVFFNPLTIMVEYHLLKSNLTTHI